jgi:hypothetical protein
VEQFFKAAKGNSFQSASGFSEHEARGLERNYGRSISKIVQKVCREANQAGGIEKEYWVRCLKKLSPPGLREDLVRQFLKLSGYYEATI